MSRTTRKRSGVYGTVASEPKLLSGLTPDQREHVLQSAKHRRVRANRVIFRTGDPAKNLFLLTRGRAKYYRVTKKGDEVLLFWLTAGDAFGLGTLLQWPIRYIGTVQTVDDCELVVWSRDKIRSLGAAKRLLAENAMHIVLQVLTAFTDRLVGLATGTAEERLAHVLFRLSRRIGYVRHNGVEVQIMNEQLASLANVSTFTASRQLKEWERQGIIRKTRGRVFILVPERLLID